MDYNVLNEASFWGRTSYIVGDGGKAIALVTVVDKEKSVAILHDLVVQESSRNQGIGKRMLGIAEDVAWHMGADLLRLSVEPGTWMESWYFRRGFNDIGYNVFDGCTCTVMEKNITRCESVEPQSESAISNVI